MCRQFYCRRRRYGVVVVGATNSIEEIDPALIRPGRLDVTVLIHFPTYVDRIAIFKQITMNTSLHKDVNIQTLSTLTRDWNGATIRMICNNAALYAMREMNDPKCISMKHYIMAIEEERSTERNPML